MCKTYHSLMHTPLHKRSPNSSISQPETPSNGHNLAIGP